MTTGVRHRVFISYHHANQREVDDFVTTFSDERHVFIKRGLGEEMSQDIINSTNTTYVMNRIRELYLRDSTVTIVMVGRCTWARRYVDWEIQATLRAGAASTRNGLIGIVLPSAARNPAAPNRLNINLPRDRTAAYGRWYHYPQRRDTLAGWIDDAFRARSSRGHLIVNPREKFVNNRQCA